MREHKRSGLALIAVFILSVGAQRYARAEYQDTQQQKTAVVAADQTTKVAAGLKMNIEGVILRHDADSLTVQDGRGNDYLVTLTGKTEIREKKRNPFRGAKTYASQQLLPGMAVGISGLGGISGSLIAEKIRFTNGELRVAEAVDTRVTPVEKNLSATETRLGQSEQNAQRLSGQLEEISSVANAARGGAKAAQNTADEARQAAETAKQAADTANTGVQTTNERISSIDNYDVRSSAAVNFGAGSTILSKTAQAELDKVADGIRSEKAFLIEVSGYASSEGGKTFNQALSQRRADEVIRYMAENYDIPLRRFVTPMGLGTTHPIADNKTREGRKENRRVEIKVLVSKGLANSANGASLSSMRPR